MAASFQRPTQVSTMRQTGTSSSQMPSSAPVIEYRCMFTNDIFKKQKKWHDGTVKYHTFNRKVMVYDESKNLVGALHYRQEEEFGEGLEIKLDRPVLVQVEDQLSESTTDLTPLMNRPGGNNPTSGNTQQARPAITRLPGPHSQIKPRSIKDVLAGSQGVNGRARLQLQSPYEQRQALNEIQTNIRPQEPQEPPPKKRKIVLTERSEQPILSKAVSVRVPGLARSRINDSEPLGNAAVVGEVMNISSDDEPTTPQVISQPAKPKAPSTKKPRLPMGKETEKFPAKQKAPTVEVHWKSRSQDTPRTSRESLNSATRPSSASCVRGSTFKPRDSGPRSSLRFPSQKPRPKLMYKALLIGTPGFSISSGGEKLDDNSVEDTETPRPRARQVENNLLETDSFFAMSQLQTETHRTSPAEPRTEQDAASEATLDDEPREEDIPPVINSPLFVSQPDPPLTQANDIHDDDPDSFLDGIQDEPETPPGNTDIDDQVDEEYDVSVKEKNLSPHGLLVSSSPLLPPTKSASPIRQSSPEKTRTIQTPKRSMAATLSSPVESRSTALQRAARDFRRVRSEAAAVDITESPSFEDFLDGEASDLELDTAHYVQPSRKRIELDSVEARANEHESRISFYPPQTEADDAESPLIPEPYETLPDADVSRPVADPSPKEIGPWTLNESFLLFEWWPKGKQKPDYGQGMNLYNLTTTDDYDNMSASVASHGMSKKYGTFGSAKFVSQR